jgi:hypothetical protein
MSNRKPRHPGRPFSLGAASAVAAPLLALLVAAACSSGSSTGSSSSGSTAGAVGKDCYPNGTCNVGLVCSAGKCMADDGTTSTGGHGGGNTIVGGLGGEDAGTTGGADGGAPPPPPEPGAPVLLAFGTSATEVSEGESVVFSAVVTDPDGIDDVIGGVLRTDAGAILGAFATAENEGAYSLSITWAELDQQQDITFASGGSQVRNFVAEFFDQTGRSVTHAASVTVTCHGKGACDAHCIDLQNDDLNCGTCGNKCDALHVCGVGNCISASSCVPKQASCDVICQGMGKTCVDKCFQNNGTGFGAKVYPLAACGGTSVVTFCAQNLATATTVQCCCG